MEITFVGKRALVTGASKGIGREIVKQLAKCGAKVVAVARNRSLLVTGAELIYYINSLKSDSAPGLDNITARTIQYVKESLKLEVPSIEIQDVDLANWKLTREALSKIGPIDLLVNNAGLAILEPLTEIVEDHVDKLFDINVKALINITQLVANNLLERKASGSIVNVSSQTSKVGLNNHSVYCGTKGAVDAFTRAAALELGPHNIRVNCVNPTVIMTDMGKLGWSDPKIVEPMIEKIPLRRFGEVHEVVDAILFLLSDKASMITGTCLPVDGGYVAV